ncbi:hypothetical protein KL86APRO_11041 [uncultured Alphaproteobacteria bacterium]|uniref:Uncharacterized protein n=1 Tax=uncultured Alphaproteobacteria bacterium TaxID=91750 RepID=A0A212JGX8_9PROT|nr:hypothetical protein KL86APRO_11041 [uncultured Alphaproteobacteria bacterium]
MVLLAFKLKRDEEVQGISEEKSRLAGPYGSGEGAEFALMSAAESMWDAVRLRAHSRTLMRFNAFQKILGDSVVRPGSPARRSPRVALGRILPAHRTICCSQPNRARPHGCVARSAFRRGY